jgi:hypothetical protein
MAYHDDDRVADGGDAAVVGVVVDLVDGEILELCQKFARMCEIL